MRAFSLLLIFITSYALGQGSTIKNFSEWKSEKVNSINSKITAIKSKIDTESQKKKTAHQDNSNVDYYRRLLEQEQWNLEIANDLSVTDYLVLYVATQPSKNKFKEAATSLKSSEIADIIESYVTNMGIQPTAIPTQATQQK